MTWLYIVDASASKSTTLLASKSMRSSAGFADLRLYYSQHLGFPVVEFMKMRRKSLNKQVLKVV